MAEVRHLLTREDIVVILEVVKEFCNYNPNIEDLSTSTPLIERLYSVLHDVKGQPIN